jgi:molecular chaperone DnaJ
MRGLAARIAVHRQIVCEPCGGYGHAANAQILCAECHGEGRTIRVKGRLQFSVNCAACGGGGRTWRACPSCAGSGRAPGLETIEVELPPGIGPSARIRLTGKGNAGWRGGPAGDLNVIVNVMPHPTFSRAGDNIQCAVPITFWEAALGAKIEVPTVDGPAIVRIPPGTQNGQILRMRGLGAPSLARPGLRGDQLITVHVVVPRIGDEQSKTILRELARLNPDNPRSGMF